MNLVFRMFICLFIHLLAEKDFSTLQYNLSRGPGPLCQAWSNEARHNGGCNLGRRVVYLQLHGHDEGDVQTLVMRISFLGFLFQAVGASSSKMEHSLS